MYIILNEEMKPNNFYPSILSDYQSGDMRIYKTREEARKEIKRLVKRKSDELRSWITYAIRRNQERRLIIKERQDKIKRLEEFFKFGKVRYQKECIAELKGGIIRDNISIDRYRNSLEALGKTKKTGYKVARLTKFEIIR